VAFLSDIKNFVASNKVFSFFVLSIFAITSLLLIIKPQFFSSVNPNTNVLSRIILREDTIKEINQEIDLRSSKILDSKNFYPFKKRIIFVNKGESFERKIYDQISVLHLVDIFKDDCDEYFKRFKIYQEDHKIQAAVEKNFHLPIDLFGKVCNEKKKVILNLKNSLKYSDVDKIYDIKSISMPFENEIWFDKNDDSKVISSQDTLFINRTGTINLSKDFLRNCLYYLLASIDPDLYFISGQDQVITISEFFKRNNSRNFFVIYGESMHNSDFSIKILKSNQKDIFISDHNFQLSGSRYCYIEFHPKKGISIGEL
jgi:hypothetical protein